MSAKIIPFPTTQSDLRTDAAQFGEISWADLYTEDTAFCFKALVSGDEERCTVRIIDVLNSTKTD